MWCEYFVSRKCTRSIFICLLLQGIPLKIRFYENWFNFVYLVELMCTQGKLWHYPGNPSTKYQKIILIPSQICCTVKFSEHLRAKYSYQCWWETFLYLIKSGSYWLFSRIKFMYFVCVVGLRWTASVRLESMLWPCIYPYLSCRHFCLCRTRLNAVKWLNCKLRGVIFVAIITSYENVVNGDSLNILIFVFRKRKISDVKFKYYRIFKNLLKSVKQRLLSFICIGLFGEQSFDALDDVDASQDLLLFHDIRHV